MPFALTHARMLLDGAFVDDKAIVIDGAHIAAIMPASALSPDIPQESFDGDLLIPGFIDTQVNGGGGVLFNDDPSVETIRAIGAAHARFGTTGFLPTLISDDLSVIRAGIAAVDDAIAQGVPGVLGIHVEGPFINVDRKGIHDEDRIRSLDEEGFEILTSLKRGKTLVTIAPETTGPAMVARLCEAGIVVAAGHTNGTYAQLAVGIEAGLTGFTHLFNAMSQLGNREPGAVGAALESDRTWCSLIVDGFHVHPATLRLAMRCKPANRFLLVTDAMPTTGAADTGFTLQGRHIRSVEGRLIDERGILAGSDLDMMSAVRNTHTLLDVPFAVAVGMASENPATFLSLDSQLGSLAVRHRASMLRLDGTMNVRSVWIDGIPV
jgi:N-acetylglucosamine-6-phosphate deacetylase